MMIVYVHGPSSKEHSMFTDLLTKNGTATAPSLNGCNGDFHNAEKAAPAQAPSPIGSNGRGSDGRFAKGNPGGPGNPFARQVAALRQNMLDAVTGEDIRPKACLFCKVFNDIITRCKDHFLRLFIM